MQLKSREQDLLEKVDVLSREVRAAYARVEQALGDKDDHQHQSPSLPPSVHASPAVADAHSVLRDNQGNIPTEETYHLPPPPQVRLNMATGADTPVWGGTYREVEKQRGTLGEESLIPPVSSIQPQQDLTAQALLEEMRELRKEMIADVSKMVSKLIPSTRDQTIPMQAFGTMGSTNGPAATSTGLLGGGNIYPCTMPTYYGTPSIGRNGSLGGGLIGGSGL